MIDIKYTIKKILSIKSFNAIIFLFLFSGCSFFTPPPKLSSLPILYFSFNGNTKDNGIQKYHILGNLHLSYEKAIKDSCLNLSVSSKQRTPIVVKTKSDIIFDHQPYLSVIIWVKKQRNDFESYGLIGNKSCDSNEERGWIISETENGSWKLSISDGRQNWEISGNPIHQNITDNQWHQLGFILDKNNQSVRTYFDGKNKAVMTLKGLRDFDSDFNLYIGCSPGAIDYAKETFNGFIDETGIWTKKLTDKDFAKNYRFIKKEIVPSDIYAGDTFTFATWNIWNGGQQKGKTAGVTQIANMIKKANIDIVAIQEDFGSGNKIADILDYHYFKISDNLSMVSRFPIDKTYHIYKPLNSGGANIKLRKNKTALFCPLWLSYSPNIRGMLMNKSSNADSILTIEKNTRAIEMKFIISEIEKFRQNNSEKTIFLAGCFNSGSHLDWTKKNKATRYQKVIPFPSTKLLANYGYKDAYRTIKPDETLYPGYTYSPIFKDGYKDRLDYVFYSGKNITVIDAKVIEKSDSFFPSDHGLLIVTFKIN